MTDNYSMTVNDDAATPVRDADGILEGSPLDILREELKKEVAAPDAVMNIPGRRKVRCVYATTIDGDLFQRWMKASKRKGGGPDDVDALRFSAIVLANQLKTLEVQRADGTWEAASVNGMPMNIQNPAFKEMLIGDQPSSGAAYLIRKLYNGDGAVMSSAQSLLTLAGYGNETDDLFGDEGPILG